MDYNEWHKKTNEYIKRLQENKAIMGVQSDFFPLFDKILFAIYSASSTIVNLNQIHAPQDFECSLYYIVKMLLTSSLELRDLLSKLAPTLDQNEFDEFFFDIFSDMVSTMNLNFD